jgi:hypothetical protein
MGGGQPVLGMREGKGDEGDNYHLPCPGTALELLRSSTPNSHWHQLWPNFVMGSESETRGVSKSHDKVPMPVDKAV